MSCDEVEPELEPWVRGELPPREAAAVKAHVAGCDACREASRWLGPLGKRLEALPPAPGDEVDADALADRVLARARKGGGRSKHPPLSVLKLQHAAAKRNARRAAIFIVVSGTIALLGHILPELLTQRAAPPAPTEDLDELLERARSVSHPSGEAETRVRPREAPVPAPPPAPEPLPAPATELPATEAGPATEPLPAPEELAQLPPVTEPPAATEPLAPTTEVASAEKPRRERAARADRLGAEARVRRAGGAGWTALAAGDLLAEGDEVEALRGPIDLALLAALQPDGEDRSAGLEPTDRLLLAAGGRATIGPDGARLEAGQAVAFAREAVVLAGPSRVTVHGDASLELGRGGELQVAALAGQVELGQLRLEARQRVAIDARGKAGKVGGGPAEPPAWALAARRLSGPRLAGTTPGAGLLPLALGEAVTDAGRAIARGVATPTAPTPTTRAVTFGQGLPGGGWRHVAGSTLRIVYRLSAPAALGVTLADVTRGQDVQAVLRSPRAGVWTTLDVDLDQLAGVRERTQRLAPGDVLDLVTVSSHGEGQAVTLEVAELFVTGP